MLLAHFALVLATSPSPCDRGEWLECRVALTRAIFNSSVVPDRLPDYVLSDDSFVMHGLPGPGTGTGVGAVSWTNNLTRLVWTMRSHFLPAPGALNATVLYSLNTSSR